MECFCTTEANPNLRCTQREGRGDGSDCYGQDKKDSFMFIQQVAEEETVKAG